MDGCVFLDELDRKMILVRVGWKVMRLSQSGISKERRFSFYDQVHTTGMDMRGCEIDLGVGPFCKAHSMINYAHDLLKPDVPPVRKVKIS